MDERAFVESRKATWERLQQLLIEAERAGRSLRGLPRGSVREIGPLYRRAAADLALARAQAATPSLVAHLNSLVSRAFALLYAPATREWGGVRSLVLRDFPATVRRRVGFILAAFAATAVGALAAYALVSATKGNIDLFVPPGSPMRSSLDQWMAGQVSKPTPHAMSGLFAGTLMTNNIRVSFLAFASGVLLGVPTLIVLFENGLILGAFAGMMSHAHQHSTFWPGILPHGITELTAIFIAGGAGLGLGWAVLAPGAQRRRDAVVGAARDSAVLVLGTITLLIFAGFVEAFISHSAMPAAWKYLVAAGSAVALFSYLGLSGRERS